MTGTNASEIALKVTLDKSLESAKRDFNTAKEAGATKKVPNAERDFELIVKRLEEFKNVSKPTKEQLVKVNSLFNKLNDILIKLGNNVTTVSKETKEIVAREKELTKARKAEVEKLEKANTNLSKKKNGEYGLKSTYKNEQVKNSGLTWASGSHKGQTIKNFDSLKDNIDNVSDPKAAKELIQKLAEEEKAALEAKAAAENSIKELDEKIKELESKKSSGTVGDEIVGNASTRQADVEKATGDRRKALSDPENRPIDIDPGAGKDGIEMPKSQKSSNAFGQAFKQFSLYAIALKTIKKAVSEAVSTIKELDKSLTEQAMVTGKTRKQTYALLSTYQQLAAETGSTTREISELATQFMRQGKTTQDALTLTKAAMDAAKVAGISATDSVNYLTTALNGFQMSATDAMLVSDKFAAIAANSATSYDEIATALSKVASQANLAGMSIDYTTALLAKGLETTREAPETMGTALKTVIARMREISDYGETLGGDTDVNNVESQLAYVGIALKDANGELRSTEDVLDDLGKKWDTLNSNQQAAVAKALAGTRQQSRLIAMMTDYERVVELQQISERSAGATMAQMETYLEGMDAALNRVSIAWETIVTNLTNNEVIIGIVNTFSQVLDSIAGILENTGLVVTLMITLGAIAITMLGNKLKQYMLSKQEYALSQRQAKLDRQAQIEQQKSLITAKEKYITQLRETKAKLVERLNTEKLSAAEKASLQQSIAQMDIEIAKADQELTLEKDRLGLMEQQNTYLTNQDSLLGNLKNSISGLTAPLMMIISLYKTISGLITIIRNKKKKDNQATMTELAAENSLNATNAAGKIIGSLGPWGIPIAIAVAAALAGIGLAIAAGVAAANKDPAKETANQINSLSSEIYKLENKARAIETITSSYEDLDNQIIKTIKDQEEMNELLDQAADKLSDEEKEVYNSLTTNDQKIEYLNNLEKKTKEDANKKRAKQLSLLNSLSPSERKAMLNPATTNSDYLTAQSAIYAINNNYLYEYIDSLGDAQDGVESLTQALLEKLSPAQALAFANSPKQIEQLTNSLNGLTKTYTKLNGKDTGGVADVLTSDDYSIVDKVDAYNEALKVLDSEMQAIFRSTYADIEVLSSFGDALAYIDEQGISSDNINALGKAIQKLGYDTEQSTAKIKELFSQLQDGEDVETAIRSTFEGISDEDYKKLINAYSSAMGTGILNMGQNIETLKNTINSFYENAMKWNEMSDSEKTAFLADNADLFAGEDGQRLLKAIESGDYNFIQNALGSNETLKSKVAQQLQDIDNEIAIENAKLEADRDYAYIAYLEKQKKLLEDSETLFAASLEVRLEQEQKYLDEYKSYLEDQQKALQESLDKRKEAYQNYFDAVNQNAEDEDFENKENTLIANISKLASSGSADAVNQSAKLEQELTQLEKERLETLRQQAQDAIMENLDDQVEQINQKFDDLLNSQQALLQAMNKDLENPSEFLSNLIGNKLMTEGLTDLQLQNYVQDLQSTYGSLSQFSDVDWDSLGSILNTLNLNVNGTTINNLSADEQQSIYAAIMAALQQVGLR